jgi:hypothetical protein
VKLYCWECEKDFGGSSGDHSKTMVHNLFTNFKKSHILSNRHVRAWCRQNGIPWTDHPQSTAGKGKTLILTAEDHKQAIVEGLQKLESINSEICSTASTFVCVGDLLQLHQKSFWVKVRCKVCGDMYQLCPPKKNLQANLTNHVMST